MKRLLFIVLFFLMISSCDNDAECKSKTTECDNETLKVCIDSKWEYIYCPDFDKVCKVMPDQAKCVLPITDDDVENEE